MNGHSPQAKPRTLRPFLAFFSAFLALGLAFVYVGELRLGVASVVGLFGLVAVSGWLGVMTSSVSGLWAVFIFGIGIFLVAAILPTIVAFRDRHRAAKSYNRWWVYLLWSAAYLLLTVEVRLHRGALFGYDLFRAPSVSMSPTIEKEEYFVVDTWRYRHRAPVDGEVIVLALNDGTGTKYVKRVVGVPGDAIELRDSTLIRNGQPVAEPYVRQVRPFPAYGRDFGPTVVGPSQVFVLGDYRDNSKDSRQWGTIPILQIDGRVQFIWMSLAEGRFHGDRIGIDLRPNE